MSEAMEPTREPRFTFTGLGDPEVQRTVQDLEHIAAFGYGSDGLLCFWNRGCQALFGIPAAEALGRRPVDLLAGGGDRSALAALLGSADRPPRSGLCRLVHRDGHPIDALLAADSDATAPGHPGLNFGLVMPLAIRDTWSGRPDPSLLQAHKLESLGVLAAGIAHDFNNLLLGIVGNADLVLMELAAAHPARESIEQIAQAGLRAADLCRQLLAFSGKGKVLVEALDLTDLVQSVAPLMHLSLGGARLRLNLAAGLPVIEADATQIRQAVMNLVTNAAEAQGERPGVIEIRTRIHDADREPLYDLVSGRPLPAGQYVAVAVADSGVGMSPDQVSRVFEPFVTTKFMGRGLGLAAVQGIVRAHHGTVTVETAEGVGSTFAIFLPAYGVRAHLAAGESRTATAATARAEVARTRARILVVDDESSIRQVAGNLLEVGGYEVARAADGAEALAIIREDPDSIDLVLLDMTMPGLDGLEVLERIRRVRRDLPVLLSSGYGRERVRHVLRADAACGFIQKPYRRNELLRSTASLLERRATASE